MINGGVVSGSIPSSSLYDPDIIYEGPAVYAAPATTTYGNGIQVAPMPPAMGGVK